MFLFGSFANIRVDICSDSAVISFNGEEESYPNERDELLARVLVRAVGGDRR